jgi:hypothetical protein
MEQKTISPDTNLYFHAGVAELGKQINLSFSNENIKPRYVEKDSSSNSSAMIDRFIKYSIINQDYTRTSLYYSKSNRSDEVKSHFTLVVQKPGNIQFYSLNTDGLYKNGEKVEDASEIKKAQNYLIIIKNFLENQEITAPEYRRTNLNF